MINLGTRQRIARLLLALFVSLLTLVTLHEVGHRYDHVQTVTTSHVLHDHHAAQLDKAECSLCQFVHTPFLSLDILPSLVAVSLGVALLLHLEVGRIQRFARLCQQLRAPPVYL